MDSLARYIKRINRFKLLNFPEEVFLVTEAQKGSRAAKDTVIKANLRLVTSIVVKYTSYKNIDVDDLIQEGNLGLIHAINRHNVNKGCKLSTYATPWIKHYITRFISNKGFNIRYPVSFTSAAQKLDRIIEEYENKNGLPPTIETLSLISRFQPHKILEIYSMKQGCHSLDYYLENNIDTFYEDPTIANDLLLDLAA